MKSLLGFAVCLLLSNVAVAQYASPPGYGSPPVYGPPPGYYYAPPPGYAPPPAYDPPQPAAPTAPAGPRLTGVVLSTELGFALPFGTAAETTSGTPKAMTDYTTGHVPFVFGAGYRFHPMVSVGGILQYGFAQLNDDFAEGLYCTQSGISCIARDLRIGVEARVHFLPQGLFSPWASVGFGYNWFNVHASSGGESADLTFSGLELLNIEGGGDFRVASIFTIGPFMGFRLQRWSSASVSDSFGNSNSGDIVNQTIHGWISFGVRGAFTL
jgi:hypothetical protein